MVSCVRHCCWTQRGWRRRRMLCRVLVIAAITCCFLIPLVFFGLARYPTTSGRTPFYDVSATASPPSPSTHSQVSVDLPSRRISEAVTSLPVSRDWKSTTHASESHVTFDCRKIAGNESYLEKVVEFTKHSYKDPSLSDLSLAKAASNCKSFVLFRNYNLKPLSLEEARFPIAFSVVVYKDAGRVERLLRAIYQPQNVYCIHVDDKAPPALLAAMRSLQKCLPGVFLSSRNVNVRWGHFTVLEAELICMSDLVKRKTRWRYFINLTGQEFPLRTNHQLVRILQAYDGANDIAGYSPRQSQAFIQRVKFKHHLSGDGRGWFRSLARKGPMPFNVTFIKGRVHITASRAFVEFAVRDHRAQTLASWLKDTGIPDEVFFPVLQYNPHLGAPGSALVPMFSPAHSVNRYKYFRGQSERCRGKFHRDICIFGLRDLPSLYKEVTDGMMLFVNKFHSDYQPLAYDCLEELIRNRTRQESVENIEFDSSQYKQLFFVENFHRGVMKSR